jgi:hypothetical protein
VLSEGVQSVFFSPFRPPAHPPCSGGVVSFTVLGLFYLRTKESNCPVTNVGRRGMMNFEGGWRVVHDAQFAGCQAADRFSAPHGELQLWSLHIALPTYA